MDSTSIELVLRSRGSHGPQVPFLATNFQTIFLFPFLLSRFLSLILPLLMPGKRRSSAVDTPSLPVVREKKAASADRGEDVEQSLSTEAEAEASQMSNDDEGEVCIRILIFFVFLFYFIMISIRLAIHI
jgi:hypothetical protein